MTTKLKLTQQQYEELRRKGMSKEEIVAQYSEGKPSQTATNIADKIVNFTGLRGVTEQFGSDIARIGAPQDQKNIIDTMAPPLKNVVGSAVQGASLFAPVGALGAGITGAARAAGMVTGASALGKVGAGAATGLAYDVGANLQSGKPALQPGIATALGAAIPAAGVGLNIAGRTAKAVVPKLLSYTSDIPEQAFEQMIARREPVVSAIKQGTSGKVALQETQSAVRGLRKTLSAEWQEGATKVSQEFTGKSLKMDTKLIEKLSTVADEFGLENIPANPSAATVDETIALLKEINQMPKLILTLSPKGAVVRQLKDQLKEAAITAFGGKKGSLDVLYSNYSAKKAVHDAADDIVKAYATGKPIQQSTAQGRLTALFSENKTAYLDAILDLERVTGKDLLSKITAAQFQNKLPSGTAAMTTSGTLRQSKSAFDKAFDMLLLPLTSPRFAGLIARATSKISAPSLTTPGDMFLGTKTGQATLNYAKNLQPGLSTKAVKIHPDDQAALIKFIDAIRLKGKAQAPNITEQDMLAAELILTRLDVSLDSSIDDLARAAEDILTGQIDAAKLYKTGRAFK